MNDTDQNPAPSASAYSAVETCGKCKKPKGLGDHTCKCGRPTDYTPELVAKAWAYLDLCEDTTKQETIGMSAKGTELYKKKVVVKIPSKGGLARYLRVSRETLYDWAKKHKEFSDIMEELGAKQEEALINNGLSGDYNPTIAKVLLSKHGYSEKIEQDVNNPDGNLKTIIINKHGGNNRPTSEANPSVGTVGE